MKKFIFLCMINLLSLNQAFAEDVFLRWKGEGIILEPQDGKAPIYLDKSRGNNWNTRRVPTGKYHIINGHIVCSGITEFEPGLSYQILSVSSICKVGRASGP